MDEKVALSIRLELFWWVFTLVVAFGVLYPILRTVSHYPFLLTNLVYIFVFITFTRYVFLLQHTFLAHKQVLKAIVIALSIPLIFYLISELNFFQTYLDEQGLEGFMGDIPYENRASIGSFIRNEMMLFGVGSIIIAIIFPFRMLLSLWRWKNRGTV
ncbi:MAG: hypothetical protein AAGD05_13975 [Bacteroidota bacterium]